jgi:hypothetical protein
MKKVFISQPMRGRTKTELKTERKHAVRIFKQYYHDDVEVLDIDIKGLSRLEALGKSIMEGLAKADIAVFVGDWVDCDKSRMEQHTVVQFGIPVFYITADGAVYESY